MIFLKNIIKYTNANALEALWVEVVTPEQVIPEAIDPDTGDVTPEKIIPAVEIAIRRQAYSDRQMDMLRQDIADEMTPEYEAMIQDVEANQTSDEPTPQPILSCSPWQMRKKLNKEDLRQTVEDYVARTDTPIEIKDGWLYATEFREDDPFVQQMAVMLQVSDLHAFIEDALTL